MIGGRLYVLGGFVNPGLQATTRVDVYDPVLDAWSSAANMPVKITHEGAALDGTKLWIAGGFQGDNPGFAVADVRIYDSVADAWSSGPPLPSPRAGGPLVRFDRELHYFGGVLPDRNTNSADHWMLDLDDLAAGWVARAPLPDPRNHLSGARVGARIYAVGGQHNHDVNPIDVASVHAYDPVADVWTQVASLPFARSHCEPGTSVVGGKLRVAGGRGPTPNDLSIGEVIEYDPQANAWSFAFSLPMSLFAPVAQPVGGEYVVSCGGPSVFAPQTTTWKRPLASGPPSVRRVDAGSTSGSTQSGPTLWCPDEGFLGGAPFVNGQVSAIANTVDDHLYRSERSGGSPDPSQFGYAFPVANGYYRVRLHFAEIYWGAPGGGPGGPGRRVFDVALEGQTVLDDYDVGALAGPVTARIETFERPIVDGVVDLAFDASVDEPSVAAIEVIDLSAGSVASYCTTSPNSVGPGATLSAHGSTSIAVDDLVIDVAGGHPAKTGILFFGSQTDSTPLGDGVRCVNGQVHRLVTLTTDASGGAHVAVDFASAPGQVIAPGSTWHFQLRYRDPAGPGGTFFNFSDALTATFWP